MTAWAELWPDFAIQRIPCAERASAHGLIARNNQLRVAAWNQRAIRAYQKSGFSYVKTIQDEIAYSNHMEDFWVMELL